MIYSFNGTTLPNVATIVAPLPGRIGSADTPGRAGGYNGRRYTGTRGITVTGTLQVATSASLDDAWSTLCAAHNVQTPAPLIIRENWYFLALPENLSESERTVASLQWEATYRAADPYAYSTALSTPTISTSGGTLAVGGNAPARPFITLSVSAVASGCSITIVNTTTGETLIISPPTTGAWNVDSLAEQVTFLAVDRSEVMQGQFLSLAPGVSNTLTITCTGGAALSAVDLSFRARSV